MFNLASQALGILLVVVQGIVLVPFYLKVIPVAVYGSWLALTNVLSWFEMADPGISATLGQRVAFAFGRQREGVTGDGGLAEVIGSGLALTLAMASIPLLALPWVRAAPSWVGYSGPNYDELARGFSWAVVSVSVALLSYGVSAVCVGLHLSASAGLSFLAGAAAGIGVTVWALAAGHGILALPAGSLVRSCVQLAGNGARLATWLVAEGVGAPRVSRVELRQILGTTSYTALSRVAGIALTRMDAFLCARFVSPSAAAVLALTGKAFDVARMVTERLGTALSPGLASLLGEGRSGRAREVLQKARHVAALASAFGLGGVVGLNEGLVELWVGKSLFGGLLLTVLMGLASSIGSNLALAGQALFAGGGIRETSILTTSEAAARLLLQVLLLRLVGLPAIPLAAFAAAVIVSAWRVPALIAGRFGGSPSRTEFWRLALRLNLLSGTLGVLTASVLRESALGWNWPRLGLLSMAIAVVLAAACYVADAGARDLAREAASELRRWVIGTPAAAQKGAPE